MAVPANNFWIITLHHGGVKFCDTHLEEEEHVLHRKDVIDLPVSRIISLSHLQKPKGMEDLEKRGRRWTLLSGIRVPPLESCMRNWERSQKENQIAGWPRPSPTVICCLI